MRRFAILFLICSWFISFASHLAAEERDFQFRSYLTVGLWQGQRWSLGLESETHLEDNLADLSEMQVGPVVTYRFHPRLWFGLGLKRYDFDGAVDIDGSVFLDLAPRSRPVGRWRFDSRHRAELFHVEDGADRFVFSHQLRGVRDLTPGRRGQPFGRWSQVFFWNEVFHRDGDEWGKVVENHLVPIGARWRDSGRCSFSVFLMLRSQETNDGWRQAQVIATSLSFGRGSGRVGPKAGRGEPHRSGARPGHPPIVASVFDQPEPHVP